MKAIKFILTAIFLAILLLFSELSVCAAQADGDSEIWDISRDGESAVIATLSKNAKGNGKHELLISGNGYMRSFSSSAPAPWNTDYADSIVSVIIEDGVKNISANSFCECCSIEFITVKPLRIDISVTSDNVIPYTAVIRAHILSTASEYANLIGCRLEYLCEFSTDSRCYVCEYECTSHIGGEPTCIVGALCDICGCEYGEPKEHEKQLVPEKSADCYNDGKAAHYKCELCKTLFDIDGNVIDEGDLIISAGHRLGELVEARAATCITQGNCAYYHCSVCNHNFAEDNSLIENVYIAAHGVHSGGEATCTEPALCDTCHTSYGELAPNNHSFATSFNYDSSKHWYACSCGEKKDIAGHSYTEKTIKPATETEEGIKELSCCCGYVTEEIIPMLDYGTLPPGEEDNPVGNGGSATPENKETHLNIALIIALSAGAVIIIGTAALTFVRIKKSKKERIDINV